MEKRARLVFVDIYIHSYKVLFLSAMCTRTRTFRVKLFIFATQPTYVLFARYAHITVCLPIDAIDAAPYNTFDICGRYICSFLLLLFICVCVWRVAMYNDVVYLNACLHICPVPISSHQRQHRRHKQQIRAHLISCMACYMLITYHSLFAIFTKNVQ